MTKSNASLACLAGTHDFCARQWKNGEEDHVCSCPCHETERPAAEPEVMEFVRAFRRTFLDRLPRPIQKDWDPVYGARLAGFPVNICYTDLRGEHGPDHATYYFDPRTFSEDAEVRRMQYYAKRDTRSLTAWICT